MYRKIFSILLLSYAFLFFSCVSSPRIASDKFNVAIVAEKDSGLVDIQAEVDWQEPNFIISGGINGFYLAIKNNSDKIVRVVWSKSSLNYFSNSYTPFIEGQKYTNSSEPMAPTVVPAKGKIGKSVFSSAQPYYMSGQYGGWRMQPISALEVVIVVCVESGDMEDYYTITITQK